MMGGIRMSIVWTQESLLSHVIVTGKKKSPLHNAHKATDGWDMSAIQHQAEQHNNANETCN